METEYSFMNSLEKKNKNTGLDWINMFVSP